MQAMTSIRLPATSMTLPPACLLSAAFANPSISTGKERDSESGNDYFDARYYSSAMGRFMSPDWSAKVEPVPYAKLGDPQSLNLYAYVMNNPMARSDADGHNFSSHGYDEFELLQNGIDNQKGQQPAAEKAQHTNEQTPANNNTPGKQPIVVPNVEDLAGHAPFGNHDGTCYDLGVAYGMAPSSKQISPGSAPNANTQEGTLVGTFSGNGGTTYAPKSGLGHIAAFLGFGDRKGINPGNAKGMWVMDQYAGRGKVDRSFIPFGGPKNYNNDANNYRIVLSPKKED